MSTLDDIRTINAHILRKTEAFVERLAIEIYGTLVEKSPVLTGRYSSNHRLGVGAPDLTTTDETTPPALEIPAIELGQAIYFTNSLPYSNRLEHGWSQQAPAGVYSVTVAEVGQREGPQVQAALRAVKGVV